MKKDRSSNADDLRHCAEARLRERQAQLDSRLLTADEIQRLVHELQVHQMELKIQNEELRETQSQLKRSLDRYIELYDFAPVAYFTLTADSAIRELNLAGAALLGQERFRLIGQRLDLFVSRQTRPDFNAFLDRVLLGTSRERCEIALDREGVPICHARLEGVGVRDDEEGLCRLAAVDITECKRTEEALRVSEEKYRTVADFTYDWEYWCDPQGRYVYISPSCERITGYRPENFIADPGLMLKLVHPDDREQVAQHLADRNEAGKLLEFRIATRTGEERWVGHARQSAYGADGRWLGQRGSIRDITERKRSDEVLIRSEARFHGLIDHVSSVAVQGYDADGTIHYWNDASETVYGYTAREAVGQNLLDLIIPPEMRPKVRQAIRRMAETGQPLPAQELSLLHKDGSCVEVFSSYAVVQIPGRAPELFCLDIDIAHRKQVEESLRAERDRFAKIAATVPGVICSFRLPPDGNACLPYASPAIEDLYGLRAEELAESAAPLWALIHPDDLDHLNIGIATSAHAMIPWRDEFRVRHPAKGEIWVEGHSMPVREPDGGILWHGYVQDISDRKRAEAALRAALEEKEVLLREVHHRVKNNLAAIVHMLELQCEAAAAASTASLLAELGDRIRSMALVHEMLYRSDSFNHIDFRSYLQELVAHLHESFDPQSAIRLEVVAPEIWINLDAAIPCGLIVNELVTNAFKHAFPDPRSWPEPGARTILVSMDQHDAGYILTVADNGVGLPAELDWTTTRTLGLRLVRMLGQHQLRGQIEFDRTDGTRFSLRFNADRTKVNPHDR
ncbi:MAG TPA: PAS domain S-box protein [Candidatus Competibacter sp.]|nr:PAS domain S-box protein [Candidatus Competibacter sp.]